jgi:predicted MFS family arabinose efflux permease
MFVGVGEAAYGTTAPTIISDLFVKQRRGSALSLFYVAIPVGSALGYVFGGLIGPPLGWRAAFFVVGLPGLLVGALAYRMAEPRRGASEEVAADELERYLERKVGWRDYLTLLGNRSYLLNTAGMTAFTYAIGGISYWIPTFLAQERGLSLARANLMFGGITVVCGIVGTLAGGRLADRLAPRLPGAYFLVSGLGMLLAFPLFYLALRSQQPAVYWVGFAATELLLFLNTGPSNTVLVNVTAPRIRTTAFAINVLLIHALGDAISPVVMGAIADRSDLASAFRSTTLVVALSGVLWTVGTRFYRRDSERVTQLMRGPGES